MSILRRMLNSICRSDPQVGRIGSIDMILWLAHFAGIPLLGLKPETKLLQTLVLSYGVLMTMILSIFYVVFEFYDLWLYGNNLVSFTQNFCLLMTHIAGTTKLFNCLSNSNNLLRIIKKLKVLTKQHVLTKKQRKVFHDGEFETKVLLLVYVTLITLTAFLGMIILLRNPNDVLGKIFPYRVKLPMWLPLQLQLVYSALAVWLLALQVIACDYLNIAFINQVRYQLLILNLSFEQLMIEDDSKFRQTHVQEQLRIVEMNRRLNGIVEHHCELRVIGKHIESIFRMPVLMQFLTSIVIMALTGFQAITQIGGSKNLILIYFYCGCITCELGLYCWFGNETYEQSKTLSLNAFSVASWYRLDTRFRKSIVIFLLNVQQPFLFTAGGFVGLILPSFVSILSKSYSFIAVLRQFYE